MYSIIIPLYNRPDEIKELLDTLLNQTFKQFEVVIIEDGSTLKSDKIIAEYSDKLDIQYHEKENSGPGLTRNFGFEKAKYDYFIILDSDVILPNDYLENVHNHLQNEPLDAFGGPDAAHKSFTPIQKAINYAMTSFIGTGGTRTGKGNVQKKYYPRSYNMGVSRSIIDKIGGMGKLRHGQDMEFSARIYKAGFKVGLIKDAVVYHKRRTSIKKFFKQVFNWGVARINLGLLDEEMLKPIHYFPALVFLGTLLAYLIPLFHPILQPFWLLITTALVLVLIYAFVESYILYNSLKTSILSVIVLLIQVYAYGLGFIVGKLQVFSGAKTAKGFTKNYYK